ncbi:hypothetical protein JXO59_13855 [candidate division KSB1 bacterium]|nr:hypothetical protein [candidate division KSB1 bacterium]
MSEKNSKIRSFRIIVLSISSLLALIFILAFVPKLLADISGEAPTPQPGMAWEGQVMMAFFVIFMIGYGIGWWRSLWGGILLVVAALEVAIPFYLQGNPGGLIFGVPVAILGLFYIMLHRMERAEKTVVP